MQLARWARVLVVWTCLISLAGGRPGDGVDEYFMKATYIHRFLKYVTWPSEKMGEEHAPLVVGVYGVDPFDDKIDKVLKGAEHSGHPVRIERIAEISELVRCHVVFLPDAHKHEVGEVARVIADANVLLISESSDLAKRGAIINFFMSSDHKLRFEVNPSAGKRAGLKLSSSLLKLARIVEDDE